MVTDTEAAPDWLPSEEDGDEAEQTRLLVEAGFAEDVERALFLLQMDVVHIDALSDGSHLVRCNGRQTVVQN